jgi:hypothetical protein
MDIINNSGDILNIVKAVSIGLLTIFVCWAIYYFAMILRQALKAFRELKGILEKISDAVDSFKEKIEHSTSYLMLIGEGIKKLTEIMKDKNKDSRKDE